MEPTSQTYLNSLTSEKIEAVIHDIALIQKGYELYYAVDPHEIFDFCFPIDPSKAIERSIDSIADDQAALYYVFFGRRNRPVLLRDYEAEVRGLLLLFQKEMEKAFDQTSVINALMREGGLDEVAKNSDITSDEDAIAIVSKKFNIVLAVVMGIYSLGVQRFQSIYYQRLLQPSSDAGLREGLLNYRPTPLVQSIFQYSIDTAPQPKSKSQEERIYRAFYNDALAIDRMIHLNTSLERRRQSAKAKEAPRLVLYLSSADRTEKIFKEAIPESSLPLVGGEPYSFHRDRSQLLAYLVHKNRPQDSYESIEHLERVKESLTQIENLNKRQAFDYCSRCILDEQVPLDCERIEECRAEQAMYRGIQERRAEVRNLGLTTALDNYKKLLDAVPKDKSQKKVVEFFRHVFKSGVRDIAAEKMLRQQQLILMQCATSALNSHPHTYIRQEHLRAGRDFIVGTAQYLPLKPRVDGIKYRRVLELILDFYKTPPQGDEKKVGLIMEAYRLYCSIDTLTNDLDPEHELVRCLIYLAFPSTRGDRLAYVHATEMLAQPALLDAKPHTEREFRYVQCWAARRLRDFPAARDIADVALKQWPDDPRFFHGRSLNSIAWYQDSEPSGDKFFLLEEAAADAHKAIEMYNVESHANRELIAATYNTLAYVMALTSKVKYEKLEYAQECISQARSALDNLKLLIKRESWSPNHPEYFHTEAYVEYHEFWVHQNDWPKEKLFEKLEHARKALAGALKLDPTRALNQTLQKEIADAITSLGY